MSQNLTRWMIASILVVVFASETATAQNIKTENPLADFVARLEKSGANVLVKSESREAQPFRNSGFVKFEGASGIESTIFDSTDVRWIWNSDYVALIEEVGPDQWSLQRLLTPDSDIYAKTRNSANTASVVLSGPIMRRIESLDPAFEVSTSDESELEFKLLPDWPLYSATNDSLNSMFFRFDESARILEMKYRESAGDAVLEWVWAFEYPENSDDTLFPLTYVAKGAVVEGNIPGLREEDLWLARKFEFDRGTVFDLSECYLTHYGLPEPKFARKSRTWAWLLLAALLTIGLVALLRKKFSNRR